MPKSTERCKEIREQTRELILYRSIRYFARHGLAGTKIGELAKYIGIGQGTLYAYFESKEALFQEIQKAINRERDIEKVKWLASLPVPARQKIQKLTGSILRQLKDDDDFAGVIVLNAQILLEQDIDYASAGTTYQSEIYQNTAKIIEQGQKEETVVTGDSMKLADYYWGVVYLYALKKLFTTKYQMIDSEDLNRILLKGKGK